MDITKEQLMVSVRSRAILSTVLTLIIVAAWGISVSIPALDSQENYFLTLAITSVGLYIAATTIAFSAVFRLYHYSQLNKTACIITGLILTTVGGFLFSLSGMKDAQLLKYVNVPALVGACFGILFGRLLVAVGVGAYALSKDRAVHSGWLVTLGGLLGFGLAMFRLMAVQAPEDS